VGNVYSRKGTKKLWIKYLQHGRIVRESTGTDNIVKARRMLRDREGDVVKGVPVAPNVGKITFDEAATDLLNDYSMNRKRTHDDAQRRIKKHLSPFFGNRRMIAITTTDLRAYVAKRQKEGTPLRQKRGKVKATEPPADSEARRPVSAGEINRELTVLKRMFSLAIQAGRLVHKPHFPMLRENNVRAGFFEREQYLAVLPHLPEPMRPVVTFAYVTGWRINSEVLPLQWRQVDLKAGEVRLDPGTTKNMEGRVFYLTAELKKLLSDQRKAANRVQRQKGMIVQHVFFHDGTTKAGEVAFLAGHAISPSGFYHAWCRARIKAGCPGSIPHDFRRTAIRNMVRAGVPERVAMKLSGHKTRSVFDRYNIVSDGDLRDAARRLEDHPKAAAPATRGRS
jgi:integrase